MARRLPSEIRAGEPTDAVSCRELTKRFGETVAVDSLDLSVAPGETFGFLGPNGAGKTTTLRMLLGLIRPTSGEARLDTGGTSGLSRVGAMVEEPAFYPWLSGRANLRVLAGVGAPLPRRDIEAAMERAGIAGAAGDKVKTYSQGMRQRLGLAAALMRRPAILLLDEPTNGLDPGGIRDFRSLLKEVAAEGVTVFLSSHLLTEVELLCDRVAVVNRGRLAAVGPLDQLEGTRPLVRVEVAPADEARTMELLASRLPRRTAEGVITVAGPSGGEVSALLARGGVYPESLSVGRRSLEDVFMELTEREGSHATAGV
jgi:ABC-2 type transport system ATP-binding protein